MASRYRRLFWIIAPPALGIYALDRKLRDLEARYPALPVNDSTCSAALRTPNSPATQQTAYVDIYSARVHAKDLIPGITLTSEIFERGKPKTFYLLGNLWAQIVFNTRILRTEGSIIGLFSGRGWNPGDTGDSIEKYGPVRASQVPIKPTWQEKKLTEDEKRALLHGALIVERPPQPGDPHGLLVSWKLPDEPRIFFEKISRWGYPWRLMSGGRHEFSISAPYHLPGREKEGLFFDVRFSSAHDYELVPEEGDIEKQKTIPKWTARLHRGYARWILDEAVKDCKFRYKRHVWRIL